VRRVSDIKISEGPHRRGEGGVLVAGQVAQQHVHARQLVVPIENLRTRGQGRVGLLVRGARQALRWGRPLGSSGTRHAGAQPGRRTAKRTPPGQPNACGASIAPAAATTRSADRASRPGGARAPARLRLLQGLAGHRGRRGGPCSRIGQVGGLTVGRGQPGGAPGQVVQVP